MMSIHFKGPEKSYSKEFYLVFFLSWFDAQMLTPIKSRRDIFGDM